MRIAEWDLEPPIPRSRTQRLRASTVSLGARTPHLIAPRARRGVSPGEEYRMMTDADKKLVDDLYAIQALKFGEFRLKSGALSPFYVDLRGIISYPLILQTIALRVLDVLRPLTYDRIAGIPYAGLPIATAVALAGNIPMLYARKEVKDHGTRRAIEGTFAPGEVVVLIDDVITDGASKFEAASPLVEAGLIVRDFVIFLDREQGGA